MVDEDVVEEVLCRLGAWPGRFLVFSGGIEKRTLQVFRVAAFYFSFIMGQVYSSRCEEPYGCLA